MFNNDAVLLLARQTPSTTAQQVLLAAGQDQITKVRRLEILSNLCFNKNLHSDVWEALISSPLHFREAAALLSNAPTQSLASRILSYQHRDTRVAALELGIKNLTPSDLAKLLQAEFLDTDHKLSLIISGMAPQQLVAGYLKDILNALSEQPAFSGRANTPSLFESLLAKYTLISDEDVFLKAAELGHRPHLPRLLDLRPSLTQLWINNLDSMRYHDMPSMRDALAGSRHLAEDGATKLYESLLKVKAYRKPASIDAITAATLTRLSMNPSVSYSLRARALASVLELASEDFYEYPNRSKEKRQQKLLQLSQLAASGQSAIGDWLKVPATQLQQLRTQIRNLGESNYPSIISDPRFPTQAQEPEYVNQQLFIAGSPKLDAKGPQAWSIFIALLPNWESSYEDLISTATLTA